MKNDQIKDRSMLNEIVQPLTDWYRQNKRILPWRDQNNAYVGIGDYASADKS